MHLYSKNKIILISVACFLFVFSSYLLTSVSLAKEEIKLKKGVFLVANPVLQDPYFKKSVILLINYNKNGATGLIINKPSNYLLSTALPNFREFKKSKDVLYIGGPLKKNIPFFLIKTKEVPKKSTKIIDNLYCSHHIRVLSDLGLKKKSINEIRTYSGYAGWISGQLELEILRGSWKVVNADVEMIFEKSSEEIWNELLKNKKENLPEGLMVKMNKYLEEFSTFYSKNSQSSAS